MNKEKEWKKRGNHKKENVLAPDSSFKFIYSPRRTIHRWYKGKLGKQIHTIITHTHTDKIKK